LACIKLELINRNFPYQFGNAGSALLTRLTGEYEECIILSEIKGA